jgi:hypothetical protein
MKLIQIYKRKNIYYICPYSQTVDGIWTNAGVPCSIIKTTDSLSELGLLVLKELENSRMGIPRPTNRELVVLELASVKTWSAFAKIAKCISLELTDKLTFTPTKNMGREGYVDLEEKKKLLTLVEKPEKIGEIIRDMFEIAS